MDGCICLSIYLSSICLCIYLSSISVICWYMTIHHHVGQLESLMWLYSLWGSFRTVLIWPHSHGRPWCWLSPRSLGSPTGDLSSYVGWFPQGWRKKLSKLTDLLRTKPSTDTMSSLLPSWLKQITKSVQIQKKGTWADGKRGHPRSNLPVSVP